MYKGKRVGVVVPAYNEAGLVGDVIETMPTFVDRVYVVDDASTDGTWQEMRRAAERANEAYAGEGAPNLAGGRASDRSGDSAGVRANGAGSAQSDRRVVPIRHDENRGVGGAIKTGYLRAREDDVDVVAVMGGDGQMDPDHLDRILDPVVEDDADYAKGNRLVERDLGEMPTFRLVGNAILSALTKIATGYWEVGDPQNGFTAISADALESVEIAEMYEFYGYCNDLLAKLNVHGMRVVDVPAPVTYGDEESHIDYSTYVPKVSGMLLRNFAWRVMERYVVRGFHPVAVCYALATAGGVASAMRALRSAVGDDDCGGSLAAFLVSGVLVVLGMALDASANHDRCVDPEE
jgi:glycosyltransferase involved in cell wall biosynthesis